MMLEAVVLTLDQLIKRIAKRQVLIEEVVFQLFEDHHLRKELLLVHPLVDVFEVFILDFVELFLRAFLCEENQEHQTKLELSFALVIANHLLVTFVQFRARFTGDQSCRDIAS